METHDGGDYRQWTSLIQLEKLGNQRNAPLGKTNICPMATQNEDLDKGTIKHKYPKGTPRNLD